MRRFTTVKLRSVAAVGVFLILSVGAAFAVACGDSGDEDTTGTTSGSSGSGGKIADVKFKAKDFAYDSVPTSIQGGLVRFTMDNTGQEPHQAQIGRLNDGVTMTQFQAALVGADPEAALGLLSLHGGPNVVGAGESQEVVDDVPAGNYVFLCFVSGEDDVPHLAKGMIANFTVTPPAGAPASPPEAKAQVTAADFNFLGLDSLTTAKTTIEVTNAGPQPHEVTILKLENGYTVDQLKAEFNAPDDAPAPSGPPPVTEAGGIGALNRGTKGYMTVDLSAGNYALLCFVPDATTGAPHAALGMIKGITVK